MKPTQEEVARDTSLAEQLPLPQVLPQEEGEEDAADMQAHGGGFGGSD